MAEDEIIYSFQKILDKPSLKERELEKLAIELGKLIRKIKVRRKAVLVRSDNEKVDIRRTLRDYMRKKRSPLKLYYKERKKVRKAAFLLDCSESMSFYFNWLSVVTGAALSCGEDTKYFSFNKSLKEINFPGSDVRSILFSLKNIAKEKPSRGISFLPNFLENISRISDVKNIIIISDLILNEGENLPENYRERLKKAAGLFEKTWLLDPFKFNSDENDRASFTGNEVINYFWDLLKEEPDGVYIRTAEQDGLFFLDREVLYLIEKKYGTEEVGSLYRANSCIKEVLGERYYYPECKVEDFCKCFMEASL